MTLDGHVPHVNMEAVTKTQEMGLDLLTLLLTHKSWFIAIICYFYEAFQGCFRKNEEQLATWEQSKCSNKKDLVKWVSKALKITLSKANIKSDFCYYKHLLTQSTCFWKKNMDLLHFYRKTKIKKLKKVVVILIIRQRERVKKMQLFI